MQINIEEYTDKWIGGIHSEIQFWSNWFKTKGGQWSDDYAYRMSEFPLFSLHQHLNESIIWPPKVLDVGSGPVSPLGIATAKGNVDLRACDPLALLYAELFEEYNVSPYVLPEFAYAEALTDRYQRNYFDIVHMSNALDHSFMPLAGIISMLEVTKIGGFVYLCHAENEAENENYQGFHQWNVTEVEGHLHIWRDKMVFDINNEIEFFAGTSTYRIRIKGERDTIISILTKKNDISPQTNAFKNTLDSVILKKLVLTR
jgi:hypothetical protein